MLGRTEGVLRRLFGLAPSGDGQAAGLEREAFAAGELMAAPGSAAAPPQAPALPRTVIEAAIAQKLLHGWMQNRYQTRYPLVLNMARFSPAEAALLAEAIRHALQVIAADPVACQSAAGWFASIGGGELPAVSRPAQALLDRLGESQLTVSAYAVCAGGLRRRTLVNRRFLDFLAAQLAIPDDAARSLNRRFAA